MEQPKTSAQTEPTRERGKYAVAEQDAYGSTATLATDTRISYVAALVSGNRAGATTALDDAIVRGFEVRELLTEIIGPAQREIGELWHRGDITIAQEHWGSEVTRQEIDRLVRGATNVTLGVRAVVAAAPGEVHVLPASLFAALLQLDGWAVDFLGTSPPIESLVSLVRQRRPDLVALSISLPVSRTSARKAFDALRGEPRPPALLAGGRAAIGSRPTGADAVAKGGPEGVELARTMVGLGPERDLDRYLRTIGGRIQTLRRSAALSQQALADRCGLTRPYLSAVERGRQNITLEAALGIAAALGVPMSRLLAEGGR